MSLSAEPAKPRLGVRKSTLHLAKIDFSRDHLKSYRALCPPQRLFDLLLRPAPKNDPSELPRPRLRARKFDESAVEGTNDELSGPMGGGGSSPCRGVCALGAQLRMPTDAADASCQPPCTPASPPAAAGAGTRLSSSPCPSPLPFAWSVSSSSLPHSPRDWKPGMRGATRRARGAAKPSSACVAHSSSSTFSQPSSERALETVQTSEPATSGPQPWSRSSAARCPDARRGRSGWRRRGATAHTERRELRVVKAQPELHRPRRPARHRHRKACRASAAAAASLLTGSLPNEESRAHVPRGGAAALHRHRAARVPPAEHARRLQAERVERCPPAPCQQSAAGCVRMDPGRAVRIGSGRAACDVGRAQPPTPQASLRALGKPAWHGAPLHTAACSGRGLHVCGSG